MRTFLTYTIVSYLVLKMNSKIFNTLIYSENLDDYHELAGWLS